MSLNKTYAVFGLGRYGFSVALELVNSGVDVIAVDSDEKIVNSVANELPFVVSESEELKDATIELGRDLFGDALKIE